MSSQRRSHGATRDWVRGRIHKELGKLADLRRRSRARARGEYEQAIAPVPAGQRLDVCGRSESADEDAVSLGGTPWPASAAPLSSRFWRPSSPRRARSLWRPAPRGRRSHATRSRRRSTSDMRNVVYAWDPADPRPASRAPPGAVRLRVPDLRRSAWIPQSLFDSNLVTQAVVGDVDTIVGEKVGLVLWRDNTRGAGVRHGAERRRADRGSRCGGRSTASSATPRKSTASPISAPARRCSTISGLARRSRC